jgi:hypothetical protein
MTAAQSEGSRAAISAQQAREFADALAQGSSQALGDTIAAVILHGSLTLGDYLPAAATSIRSSSSMIRSPRSKSRP